MENSASRSCSEKTSKATIVCVRVTGSVVRVAEARNLLVRDTATETAGGDRELDGDQDSDGDWESPDDADSGDEGTIDLDGRL